jgi:uncharacterized LabA/DUF88 family protein
LYHAIEALKKPYLKWLNLKVLAESYLRAHESLNHVVFFTAILTWNHEKQKRHKIYLDALRAVGVTVVESTFRKGHSYCSEKKGFCSRYEEKQTDVAIAVRIIGDALDNEFDRAVLITADSDQIPLVQFVRTRFPKKRITLAAPPGRAKDARKLGELVHERQPITDGRLSTCLLPRDVLDTKGKKVASRPAQYGALAS